MRTAKKEALEKLHKGTAIVLTQALREMKAGDLDYDASLLNCARQFLKDNKIQTDLGIVDTPLSELDENVLPFNSDEDQEYLAREASN